jgi:CBS domain-containing protein
MRQLRVADVMSTDVVTARPAMPVKEVVRAMQRHSVSALPVLDEDDRLIGVVSEADLIRGRAYPTGDHWWRPTGSQRHRRHVGDIMTADVVTVGPTATLAEAARLMTERMVKRLPVVDSVGALVGVISRLDVLAALLRTDDEIREEIIEDVFVRVLWADPECFEVSVRDGVVVLTGTVDQRSAVALAERLTRRVDGVVDVVNTLQYAPGGAATESTMARGPH